MGTSGSTIQSVATTIFQMRAVAPCGGPRKRGHQSPPKRASPKSCAPALAKGLWRCEPARLIAFCDQQRRGTNEHHHHYDQLAAARYRDATQVRQRKSAESLGLDESLLTSSPGLRLALDARGNRFARDQERSNGSPPAANAAQALRAEIEQAWSGHENLPEGLVKEIFAAC